MSKIVIEQEWIERKIYFIRGKKVMVDRDLAELYEVPTKSLNLAVRRNADRFPQDFMFQLTAQEAEILRFQSETSSWGGQRYLPYVFTQEGVAMLSGVLRSKRAVNVNIEIMRAFVRLRQILSVHKELDRKLQDLEKKYDNQFKAVFDAIRQLMTPAQEPAKRKIGFHAD
jgi:hypothetical protein